MSVISLVTQVLLSLLWQLTSRPFLPPEPWGRLVQGSLKSGRVVRFREGAGQGRAQGRAQGPGEDTGQVRAGRAFQDFKGPARLAGLTHCLATGPLAA